jgi:hypothetical protein
MATMHSLSPNNPFIYSTQNIFQNILEETPCIQDIPSPVKNPQPMCTFGFHIVTHVLLCRLINFYFEYHGISDKTDAETTKLFPKSW